MLERLTQRARKVLADARYVARDQRKQMVGTEHVLWCMLKETSSIASRVLQRFDVTEQKIVPIMATLVSPEPGDDTSSFTRAPEEAYLPKPDAKLKAAIDRATKTADSWGDRFVGTEHLLFAIAEDSSTIAADVLIRSGVNLDDLRRKIFEYKYGMPLVDICKHETLYFQSGGFIIMCKACKAYWMAFTDGNKVDHSRGAAALGGHDLRVKVDVPEEKQNVPSDDDDDKEKGAAGGAEPRPEGHGAGA